MNAATRKKHRSHSAMFALSACLIASGALAQQNPFQAMKDALNKAKQELQNKLPSGSSPNSGAATQPASAAAQTPGVTTSAGALPATTSANSGGAAVFTPPTDEASKPVGPLVPMKLPDVGGIHIGMSMEETLPIMKSLHPGAPIQPVAHGNEPLSANLVSVGTAIPLSQDTVYVNYTLDQQIVFAVNRDVRYAQGIALQNVIDALRKKYGPESAALNNYDLPHNDGEITKMWWLVDEQGNVLQKVKIHPNKLTPLGCTANFNGADVIGEVRSLYRDTEGNQVPPATYCDSLIHLYVEVGDGSGAQIVTSTRTFLIDLALMRRSALAYAQGLRAGAQQKKKQELQNANQAKPNL